MSELDRKNFTTLVGNDTIQVGGVNLPNNDTPTSTNVFNIDLDPTDPNFPQYCITLSACALAAKSGGLNLERQMSVSANHLGNRTIVLQGDAGIATGFQDTDRFKMIDPNHAAAFQLESEKMDPSHQLRGEVPDKAVVLISREITAVQDAPESIDIVAVSRQEPTSLPEADSSDSLENNRFLKNAA